MVGEVLAQGHAYDSLTRSTGGVQLGRLRGTTVEGKTVVGKSSGDETVGGKTVVGEVQDWCSLPHIRSTDVGRGYVLAQRQPVF